MHLYTHVKTYLLKSRDHRIAALLFYVFCTIHLLLWTILPSIVRGNVPFDTIEGIAWGFQWQWGYDKHPPLAAWLCAFITKLFHTTGWPVYLLAQIAAVMTFWASWQLAKRFLPAWHALISVLLLEGIIYYNLITPKFNPTTLMSPLWALASLIFYLALTEKKYYQWLLLGAISALALLTKLQSLILLATFFCILLTTKQGRVQFKELKFYLGVSLGVILLTPHLIWSYQHYFPEIHYALFRTADYFSALQHSRFYYPIKILFAELGVMIGCIFLLIPFMKSKRIRLSFNSFQWCFILILSFAPLLFTLFYAFIAHTYLYSKWCTPYFFSLGIFAIMMLKPKLNRKSIKLFFILWSFIFLGIPIGRYTYLITNPYLTHQAKPDAYFPGNDITTEVILQWKKHYPKKSLIYIAGSHYLVANIVAYRPKLNFIPFFNWHYTESFWINKKELQKHGAMFVWFVDPSTVNRHYIPKNIARRFPNAKFLDIRSFAKLTGASVEPVYIGMGILPPQQAK